MIPGCLRARPCLPVLAVCLIAAGRAGAQIDETMTREAALELVRAAHADHPSVTLEWIAAGGMTGEGSEFINDAFERYESLARVPDPVTGAMLNVYERLRVLDDGKGAILMERENLTARGPLEARTQRTLWRGLSRYMFLPGLAATHVTHYNDDTPIHEQRRAGRVSAHELRSGASHMHEVLFAIEILAGAADLAITRRGDRVELRSREAGLALEIDSKTGEVHAKESAGRGHVRRDTVLEWHEGAVWPSRLPRVIRVVGTSEATGEGPPSLLVFEPPRIGPIEPGALDWASYASVTEDAQSGDVRNPAGEIVGHVEAQNRRTGTISQREIQGQLTNRSGNPTSPARTILLVIGGAMLVFGSGWIVWRRIAAR